MGVFRRKDSRHYPVLKIKPGNGTGIQVVYGREQPYVVWNNDEIEEWCSTLHRAYFVLQDVLDGNRIGEDWEEDDDEDFD